MNTAYLRLIASSLRDGASHWHEQDSAVQINHAADEIDALRSEVKRLRAENEALRSLVDTVMAIPQMTDAQLDELRANCHAAIDAARGAAWVS